MHTKYNNFRNGVNTMGSKKKNDKKHNDKRQDGAFPSKHINHDPQAESAKTKFGVGTPTGD